MFSVVLKALQSTENCFCSGKSTCCFRLEVNEFLQISDENKGLTEVCNNLYFEQLTYLIIASKFPMSGQLFLFFKKESQVQQSQFMHSSPWLRQNSILLFFFLSFFLTHGETQITVSPPSWNWAQASSALSVPWCVKFRGTSQDVKLWV